MRSTADIVIVGGGVVGSSIAWHLARDGFRGRVVIVERDPSYARASSYLATGGIRQQYGSALNVQMARHSVAFYAAFDERMRTNGHAPRVWFRQRGYLFLADHAQAARFEARHEMLRAAGAQIERLSRDELRKRLPDVSLDDIAFGTFGPEDGYLNPREVLAGFRAAAAASGATYIAAEVAEVQRSGGRVAGVLARNQEGEARVDAPIVVNAAGAYAAAVGDAAGVSLPIEPQRQHLFRLALPSPWPYRFPMVFDPTGVHWRHDDALNPGDEDRLIIGRSKVDEATGVNFTVDAARLEAELIPALRRRIPTMPQPRLLEGWAGLYEMTPDHNALIGEHHQLPGFYVAAGFSGHGLMMAPATGAVVSELIMRGRSDRFDISPLATDRFERGQPFRDGALI